jgi:membrane protein
MATAPDTPPRSTHHDLRHDGRGRDAEYPHEMNRLAFKDVLVRTYREIGRDNIGLLAAGTAFYALLALIPALVAALAIYSLFSDPHEIRMQLEGIAGAVPRDAWSLIREQLERAVSHESTALSLGAVAGLLGSLWSANAGIKALIAALNVVYDEEERRGFVALHLRTLAFTAGGILFGLSCIAGIAVVPIVLDWIGLGELGRALISISRWPLLVVLFMSALAVIYRFGPCRARPRWRWVSWGAVLATLVWLVGSALFSVYIDRFGSYDKTYGSLGAVIVLLLWLWLTAYAVLLGGELNSELEYQTARDSTTGRPRPLGQRGAYVADSLGEST